MTINDDDDDGAKHDQQKKKKKKLSEQQNKLFKKCADTPVCEGVKWFCTVAHGNWKTVGKTNLTTTLTSTTKKLSFLLHWERSGSFNADVLFALSH